VAPRPRSAFWPAILALCVIGAGVRSVALGQAARWDITHYH